MINFLASNKSRRESIDQVMIKLTSGEKTKSLNAPVSSRVQFMQGLALKTIPKEDQCLECKNPMTRYGHYTYAGAKT